MPDAHPDIPARAPAAITLDDTVLPFQVEALDLRGRVVRFGPAIDTILSRHNYPPPVAKLVGEAIVLTVRLPGSTRVAADDVLSLLVTPERVHLFDTATGARL